MDWISEERIKRGLIEEKKQSERCTERHGNRQQDRN